MFLGPDTLLTHDLGPSACNFLGIRFVLVYLELLTSLWCTIETKDQNG